MNDNILIDVQSLNCILKSKNKTSYVMNDGWLKINKGSCIGIVGESGSGKTQLFKTISGTQEMIPGIVGGNVAFHFDNKKIEMYLQKKGKYCLSKNHKIIKRDLIGFIPQDPKSYLNPYWTISKIFKETYRLTDKKIEFKDFIHKYLMQVDIDSELVINKYPSQLSGGEAQRVMIALVLSKQPKLIIADESTTGLDVSRQKTIIDTFKNIHISNPQLTMIFISHDFGFLSHVAKEYYVLYGGFICEHIIDESQFLDMDKLHPYTQDLISSLIQSDNSNSTMHDQVARNLLSNPLKGCPYFNVKCNIENCNDKTHFHNTIPPIFDENGNVDNVNLNKRWKRSRADFVK